MGLPTLNTSLNDNSKLRMGRDDLLLKFLYPLFLYSRKNKYAI